ncbi:ARM repeat superfamily protein [Zea mays]|uniref:ARM repeat superfamily protein n=1 Tax=Zea mays TaxID=4577 RepID=A0A1D6N0Q8_MAIZE|nr:ARM repeat superfamily protein [Zea mays]
MKRKQRALAAAANADLDSDADEPTQTTLPLESFSGDACAALTARYGRSSAPQHRHLLASAAAIRSILLDDGLPLTPASYLPAAVSALRAAGSADPAAAAALASLLVTLLPHIPSSPSPLPPDAASESASALAAFLSSPDASRLPTGTVRSVVKSLGHVTLHLDAAADWDAVAASLEALLAASVDQRAKVRKCAQESVEKLFAYLAQCDCTKKASNAATCMFEKHISSVQSIVHLNSDISEGKETEAAHMLGTMVNLVPYLSKKARKNVFLDAYQLLNPCFTPLTRHTIRLLVTLLDHLKAEGVESEVESLVSLVVAYLPYDEKKPDDTIVSAFHLIKSCLDKLVGRSKLWMEALPTALEAVSGYLTLGRKCSDDIAKVVALRCLAQLSGSMNICELFVSLVKRFDLEDTPLEPDSQECKTDEEDRMDELVKKKDRKDAESTEFKTDEVDMKDGESTECKTDEIGRKDEKSTDATVELNNKRSLLLELISTFVEVADEDLLDKLFGFIKSCLLDSSMSCHNKALFALSTIVKEHSEYSLAHLDEMMLLLHGMKSALDNTVLENQLLCYQHLLVHMIKVNEENTSKKAFLILNELIVALKSKKESRKLAYDVLLATSTNLRSPESNSADSDLQRLFTMVMGYLSSPSPHIVSGAIAALSLLIYSDANFCMEVPNLIESVLVLLQHKAIEAALGFVKVLVTSLQPQKLLNLQADIISGILPWSLVTKHHFKGKVGRNILRRKLVDSNAETGQGTPSRRAPPNSWSAGKKQGKDFHLKRRTGRGNNPHAAKRRHLSRGSGGKGDRTTSKPKSKWQPGK